MSEEALRRLLERLGNDAAFVEGLKQNPEQALGEYDLSQTERVALTTNDEDGLRRLAGLDVSSFMLNLGQAGTSGFCTAIGSGCQTGTGPCCPSYGGCGTRLAG